MALDSNDLPQEFGEYTLLRRIAVGGMAEVYVAKTGGVAGFEKLVALKVIHPRLSEDEHFTQMLVEEAKIAVLLTHVNIAQTFDLGKIDDTYFIAMEFIEGADAYRVMRRCTELRKAIPIDVATFIVAEMCSGLDYAHRKRDPDSGQPLDIVHRDISPQNVLISSAGEVKIVDFGIAKAASRSTQTEVGVIKGKYYYMSPEQAWGDPMDHRSDVFSTGVVLYELLTGRMLYQDADVATLLDTVRKAQIAPPETRRPSVPRALSDIVMKALAKDPGDRWASAMEMGQALHQFLYATSPTFSAARVADLIALLFPAESGRSRASIPNLEALPPEEAKRDFDLGDGGDGETRNDLRPFKRPQDHSASEERRASSRPTPRPPGRSDGTRELPSSDARVSLPQIAASGAWIAPVTSDPGVVRREVTTHTRHRHRGAWEDPTDLQANEDEEFDDSTLVDRSLGRVSAREPGLEPASGDTEQLASPRGSAPLSAARTMELPLKGQFDYDGEDTTHQFNSAAPSLRPTPARAAPPAGPASARPPRPAPLPLRMSPSSVRPEAAPTPRAASRHPPAPLLPAASPALRPPQAAPPFAPRPPEKTPAHLVPPYPLDQPKPQPQPAPRSPSAEPPSSGPGPARLDPYVTAGLAALSDEKPFPWLSLTLGLLLLAVMAGAVVYALVPSPSPAFEISSLPSGATVAVDGAVAGVTPLVLRDRLVVGQRYTFQVSLDGHQASAFELRAVPGTDRREVVLSPLPAVLHIDTQPPGAQVAVGGAARGRAPLDIGGLFVGAEVEVRADAPDHHPRTARVRVLSPTHTETILLEPAR
ncbi:MAG: serine/threonine-protein kinase [Deltaproteobacteria bacterium]